MWNGQFIGLTKYGSTVLAALTFGDRHAGEHAVTVETEMPRGFPQFGAADMRSEDHLVTGAEMLATPEVLDRHADASPLGMPVGQPGADVFADAVQIQLASEAAMVALLGLFDAGEFGVQIGLRRGGHAVEPLQHRVGFFAAIIGACDREDLECAQFACADRMRPAAEIEKPATPVERNRLARRDVGQTLELEGLTGQQGRRLATGDLQAFEEEVLANQLRHFSLDRRKIVGRQPVRQIEVIIKAVVRRWADVEQHRAEQPADRRRHHMRRAVAQNLEC
jgi:hypothetical protein